MQITGSWRRARLAALVAVPCTLAALAAPAQAIKTVEYHRGITQVSNAKDGGDPQAIVAGPDGNLWFTEFFGRVGRITPSGSVTEFTGLPRLDGGIAAGPDGALWFNESPLGEPATGPGFIGRITTDGKVSTFTLPGFRNDDVDLFSATPHSSIVAGPDGALWFTNVSNLLSISETGRGFATVGRLATDGTVKAFVPPYSPPSLPSQIVVGPDKALWFAEPGLAFVKGQGSVPSYGGIVRISTDGQLKAFDLAHRNVFPLALASGPDGALWFADERERIGRMTTSGALKLFRPVSLGVRESRAIVRGPDGNLWFTAPAGKVGRITTSGFATIFQTASRDRSAPASTGLAVGPDGNLWMTEPGGPGVVKIAPPRGTCVVPRVVGLRLPRAAGRLHRAGCSLGTVTFTTSHGDSTTAKVIRQSVRPGRRLPRESDVSLRVR
jgi:virginiamycin B lyase